MRTRIAIACALVTGLMGFSAQAHEPFQGLKQAVESDFRQAKNVERDVYRHPQATLEFLQVKATDTVIELWPGGGWYAEILGPYLAKNGRYIAASFDTEPSEDNRRTRYRAKVGKKFEAWLEQNKAQFKGAAVTTFDPPSHLKLGDNGSADVVLTFRNLHNWAMGGQLDAVFGSAYRVLKAGGTFGVIEHRANPGMDSKTGYMDQQEMIDAAINAGFVLAETSEVNANAKDMKAYPKGVWTLPPTLAMGDEDKAKYLAIGESDRMTLKFIKPMK